jgi:hypothetical protein
VRSRSRRFVDQACRIIGSCRGRIHQAVVAALDVGMILIAGDQEERVTDIVGVVSVAGDLALIVDVDDFHWMTGKPEVARAKNPGV